MAGNDFEGPGDGTQVDLGEDLVEKTAMIPSARRDSSAQVATPASTPKIPPTGATPFSLDDQLQTAQIQISEGFLEEAKKTLRGILRQHPGQGDALAKLEQVHQIELKQIFGGHQEGPGPGFGGRKALAQPGAADSSLTRDELLARLDRDFAFEPLKLGPFEDRDSMVRFAERIDREFPSLSPRDQIDMGIAFLEMGLPEVAETRFEAAQSALALREAGEAADLWTAAVALRACALIADRRPFEAILVLEPAIEDAELADSLKVELWYWMGRAQQQLGQREEARSWYGRVRGFDAGYRDISERIQC